MYIHQIIVFVSLLHIFLQVYQQVERQTEAPALSGKRIFLTCEAEVTSRGNLKGKKGGVIYANCDEPNIIKLPGLVDSTVKGSLEWAVNTSAGNKYDAYICILENEEGTVVKIISPIIASGHWICCQLHMYVHWYILCFVDASVTDTSGKV